MSSEYEGNNKKEERSLPIVEMRRIGRIAG